MKFVIFSATIILFCACSAPNYTYINNSNNDSIPTAPGCFLKCLMPDEYGKVPCSIIEYTGDDYDDPNVRKDTLILKEPRQVWVKKEDKQTEWSLEDQAGQYIDYYTIVDTSLSKEFVINNNFEKEVIVKKGGYTAWQEVVCDNDISPKLYSDISDALTLKGYIADSETAERGTIDSIKERLVQYQRDHNLPLGSINLVTINHLGVKI